jgi:predicted permease
MYVRNALRTLVRHPATTTICVLSLAAGVGLNATIFSAVDTILVRTEPFTRATEIVRLESPRISELEYSALKSHNTTLAAVATYRTGAALVELGTDFHVLGAEVVSGNYFSVLGVGATLGRVLSDMDVEGNSGTNVVVSHAVWRRLFGEDPHVIGRPIKLNGRVASIVGVAAPRFYGTRRIPPADVWFVGKPESDDKSRKSVLIGRLKQGVTLSQARAEFELLVPRFLPPTKLAAPGQPTTYLMAEAETHAKRQLFAKLLLPLPFLVLLVACMNAAVLLLVQAEDRKQEFAIRFALGGSRRQLLLQSLSESGILSCLAVAAALIGASWAVYLFPLLVPTTMVRVLPDLQVDFRVLVFGVAAGLFTTIVSALAPAIRISRANLRSVLQGNALLGQALGRWSGKNLIVVVQLTVAITLLSVATLLWRGFHSGLHQDFGFEEKDVGLVTVVPELNGVKDAASRSYFGELVRRIRALPTVKSASLADHVPFARTGAGYTVAVRRLAAFVDPTDTVPVRANIVDEQYFDLMGIRILKGRGVTTFDRDEAERIMMVSQTMARQFWPDDEAVGQYMIVVGKTEEVYRIVGVVGDVATRAFSEPKEAYAYFSFYQVSTGAGTLLFRPQRHGLSVAADVRKVMHEVNPAVVPIGAGTVEDLIRLAMTPHWVGGWLVSALALIAFVLALGGLYGVIAYSVTRRTREIGVRIALGAQRSDVMLGVLRQGLMLMLPALALGGSGAWAIGMLLRKMIYGLDPMDPITIGVVLIMIVAVVLLATYLPARRAASVDPVVALRAE